MKKILTRPVYFLLLIIICIFSCNKPPDIRKPDGTGLIANKVPVADAGSDQVITLPTDSVVLDGTASKDWDGTISSYWWNKISGPGSYLMIDSTSVKTLVTGLVEGAYMFELRVMDEEGLTATDMVEVYVKPAISYGCNGSDRPSVNITLTEIGTLSQPRIPYVAAAGNKIVFAGGPYLNGPWYYNSSAVDIYDVNLKTWSTATLSKEREGIAAASCGNKIFFAGGGFWEWAFSNIDIYDVSANTWTRTDLSIPRSYLAAATVGTKVLFAGGFTDGWQASTRVDIYDLTTNTWSTAELSEARYNLSAVVVRDKIYFAAGYNDNNSAKVDIYNSSTNSWSTSTLQQISGWVSGAAVGNNIYWGGINQSQHTGQVEVWNTTDGSVTFDCLTYPRIAPAAAIKNDDVIFFTSSDWGNEVDFAEHFRKEVDIYNTITSQWYVGLLPYPIIAPAIVSNNNSLYMAGGRTGIQSCSDKVYILNW